MNQGFPWYYELYDLVQELNQEYEHIYVALRNEHMNKEATLR